MAQKFPSNTAEQKPIPPGFRFSRNKFAHAAGVERAKAIFGADWRKTAKLIQNDRMGDHGDWIVSFYNNMEPGHEIMTLQNGAINDFSPQLPGRMEFYSDGGIATIEHYRRGKLSDSAKGEAARRRFYMNGELCVREYYTNGELHKAPDGSPTVTLFQLGGDLSQIVFLEKGRICDPKDGFYKGYPARLDYSRTEKGEIEGGISSVSGNLSKRMAQKWIDNWTANKVRGLCDTNEIVVGRIFCGWKNKASPAPICQTRKIATLKLLDYDPIFLWKKEG